ncbi:MAG: glycosyltransferase family 4 protein [Rhodospirillales bacterium]|nr:glycosyltransferase family 4 protein [Rhodospirillales bacterium]MCW9002116.1 glycosyltransferase family 4 protein [Rhodospirillales bacterium]
MARIVIADDGIRFDGRTLRERPLGGVESSVVALAEELARRGHEVMVRNMCEKPIHHEGVDWAPLAGGLPDKADLYIANRGDRLLNLMPGARRTAFWIHNPARYLLKWRYLSKLWRVRPVIVFIGDYHATTCPGWVPDGGRAIIPYGIPDLFRKAPPATTLPAPRAIFTSNPLRGLDWLLDIWEKAIRPQAPDSELHVFSGPQTYGSVGDDKAAAMKAVLDRAAAMADYGVVLRGPVPKESLVDELRSARVMLYRSDINETFCLALGEAQAMGVPCVVQNIGSAGERVMDGVTGSVVDNDADFAAASVALLSDEGLWMSRHRAALEKQRVWGWPDAAAAFERLID